MKKNLSEIRTIDSRVVYETKWMKIREDEILYPDGMHGIFSAIEKPDFVVIAAVTDEKEIFLVEQYRYPVKARTLELPGGSWQEKPVADHEELARAELREETGLTAKTMVYVGRMRLAAGMTCQAGDVYVARDLIQGAPQLDSEEQGMVTKKFSVADIDRMILNGDIMDMSTIASLNLIRLKGLI